MLIRRLLKFIALLAIILLALTFIPSFFTFNHLKPSLVQIFKTHTHLDVGLAGDIAIEVFPSSKIILNNVHLELPQQKSIEVLKIVLDTNWSSLFTNKIEINGLKLVGTQLEADMLDQMLSKESNLLPVMELEEVNLVLDKTSNTLNKINNINAVILYQPDKIINFKGKFDLNNLKYNVNADLNITGKESDNASTINIVNDFAQINMVGTFKQHPSYYFDGKITSKFVDSKTLKFSPLITAFLRDNIQINSIVHLEQKKIAFKEFSLKSNNITGIEGEFNLALASKNEIASVLEAKSINLDKIFSNVSNQNDTFTMESFLKGLLISFSLDIPSYISGNINVLFKEFILNSASLKDVSLKSDIFQGKFSINDVSIVMPGNAIAKFSGNLTHNNVRPKFDGSFVLEVDKVEDFGKWIKIDPTTLQKIGSEKFSFKSQFNLIPRNFMLDDVAIKWGAFESLGQISLKYTDAKKLSLGAIMHVNKFEADDYQLNTIFDNFISNLYAYDFDKSGENFIKLTNDFKWLREFPIELSLDVLIDKFKFKEIFIPNFGFSTNITANNLSIEDISLKNEDIALKGSLSLITSSIAPKFDINIESEYIHTNFLSKFLPAKETMVQKQIDAVANDEESKAFLIPGGINFYSLYNFIGNFKIYLKSLIFPSITLNELNINGNTRDGILNLEDVTMQIFDGQLRGASNIIFNSIIPTFSSTFALNNFSLEKLLFFYGGYNNLNGYMSLNGNIITKGSETEALSSNLNGKMNLLGKKIVWKTFDIGELIRATEYKSLAAEKMEKIKFSLSNGESVFDDLKGNLEIINGIANLTNAQLTTNRLSAGYTAQCDIKNQGMASRFRFAFIPTNRASPLIFDIISTGKFPKLSTKYEYDKYMQFIKDQAIIKETNEQENNLQTFLRNRQF